MEDTEGERWRNVNIAREFNKALAAKDPATARWASFTDNMIKTTNCSGHVCAGPNGAPTCGLPGVAGQGTSYVDMAEVEPGKLPGYRCRLGCILLKMAAISLPTGLYGNYGAGWQSELACASSLDPNRTQRRHT